MLQLSMSMYALCGCFLVLLSSVCICLPMRLIHVLHLSLLLLFLQDGDFNLMIVARYLHRYNDDARPGTSMEAFLVFFPRSCLSLLWFLDIFPN